MPRSLLLLAVLCLFAFPLRTQTSQQPQAAPVAPAADSADVASPDAILAATYDVISGSAGKKRDWDRFRSLFSPGARLVPVGESKAGGFAARTLSPEEYVSHGDAYFEKNGFFEREIARRTERWGNILQAFSTYESRHDAKDSAPFERGINSFQLYFDGKRWWVVNIMWQGETPSTRLTPEFLSSRP